jgi:hypothetical protein
MSCLLGVVGLGGGYMVRGRPGYRASSARLGMAR